MATASGTVKPIEGAPGRVLRSRRRATDARTYEVLARTLADAGVDRIFCVMGDANLELLAHGATGCGIRLVHARHEQGAVAMADGFTRASGELSVCSVTCGPGLTNAATSLATAARHGSSVLVLAGDVALGDRRNVQRLDQARFVEALELPCRVATSPISAITELTGAIRHVRSGHGPAVVDLPVDVQQAPAPRSAQPPRPAVVRRHVAEPDAAAIADAARELAGSERPVLLAGRGVIGAKRAIVGLAEQLGAPVVTTLRAKGLVWGHPLDAGCAGALGQAGADEALRAADVVCALGARLDDWTTSGGRVIENAEAVIQVDTEPRMLGDVAAVTVPVLGDGGRAAQRLTAMLAQGGPARDPWWIPTATPAADGCGCGCGTLIHPGHAVQALDAALSEDRTVVLDGGHFAIFTAQGLSAPDPTRFMFTSDFGAIGQGLGVAIGAALGAGGARVTAVLGDGCLMMSLADLDTAAQLDAPLTLFVMNDEGYGQERHSLVAKGFSAKEAMHPTPDLVALARAAGLAAHRLSCCADLDRLPGILDSATGPLLIDVQIDGTVLNPAARKIFERVRAATNAA